MAHGEPGAQLMQRVDNHVAMTFRMVALDAEQAQRLLAEARRQLDERRPRPVVEVLAVDGGAALDVACPIALAAVLLEEPLTDLRVDGRLVIAAGGEAPVQRSELPVESATGLWPRACCV